ncbi:hypothetical protein D3C78_784350 [compost metagenome]
MGNLRNAPLLAAPQKCGLIHETALRQNLPRRVGKVFDSKRGNGIRRLIRPLRESLWEQRGKLQRPRRIAYIRIYPVGRLVQQHEGDTAPATPSSSGTGTGGSGWQAEARVDTGGDGLLNLLDFGQVLGSGCIFGGSGLNRGASALARQQLVIQQQRTVTPHGELAAIDQANGYGAPGTGEQLLTGIDSIPLTQLTLAPIRGYGKNLSDHHPDKTDQRSHHPTLHTVATGDCHASLNARSGPNSCLQGGYCRGLWSCVPSSAAKMT